MKKIIHYIVSRLETHYPADEATALAWWIAEETTGCTRTRLQFDCKDTTIFSNLQAGTPFLEEIIDRLLHDEPIQYIFGHSLWNGLDIKVTPATLIPRPETAELVDQIHKTAGIIQTENAPFRVLDIGTGSGCIAIALKKAHPEWQVLGIDISAEAVEIAKENAQRNGVEVDFKVADIFANIPDFNGVFDLVVSNPPYICESEKKDMRPNVLAHEPSAALFVPDDDPLRFYRRIVQSRMGERLYFEINEAYPEEMKTLMCANGYTDIIVTNDIYGKPRIIQGRMA
ncbi:MAG: peptide chain release factor N(5)-glutamine methyltransferase [Paludibacteraceae bacterium]|nr:peptide chain release factor N(5)-glutamine methyltransferase [Paludibacteraceae bacterium]